MIATVFLVWSVFASSNSCIVDSTIHYGRHTFKNCAIVGYSGTEDQKTYSVDCDPRLAGADIQIEIFQKKAEVLDAVSRRRLSRCELREEVFAKFLKNFETHRVHLENPDCFLSEGAGQLTLHLGNKSERCSFEMNKASAEEFAKKTGSAPFFQCEAGEFLGRRSAEGTPVYLKIPEGWSNVCRAGLVRSPVPNSSGESAGKGYIPPEPHVTPAN